MLYEVITNLEFIQLVARHGKINTRWAVNLLRKFEVPFALQNFQAAVNHGLLKFIGLCKSLQTKFMNLPFSVSYSNLKIITQCIVNSFYIRNFGKSNRYMFFEFGFIGIIKSYNFV